MSFEFERPKEVLELEQKLKIERTKLEVIAGEAIKRNMKPCNDENTLKQSGVVDDLINKIYKHSDNCPSNLL